MYQHYAVPLFPAFRLPYTCSTMHTETRFDLSTPSERTNI